jgi:hypothetical protein
MKSAARNCLPAVILAICSQSAWAIYGPSLARTDTFTAVRACREGNFDRGQDIAAAMQTGQPEDALRVLPDTLRQWKATPTTSELYPARAFCVHELVPAALPAAGFPNSDPQVWRQTTPLVTHFQEVGIEYFYYGPDAQWTLRKDPVDLNDLASRHLSSRWGRQAFLMMTQMGWSNGGCAEGPDQFREVIKHSETFLAEYPGSEVSNDVRLETAKAYGTWWHVSRLTPQTGGPDNPASYLEGSREARRKAIELYQNYLSTRKTDDKDVERRLKSLEANALDPRQRDYDYWCPDYED